MVAHESDRARREARLDELTQTLLKERARLDQLARALATEQSYSDNLARQLQTVCRSRIWRASQWLRQVMGRGRFIADLERPVPGARALDTAEMASVFRTIYAGNTWGSAVSHSGTGSDLQQTEVIREALPPLVRELGVSSILDIPCGDFHWLRTLNLDVDYIGADVVPELICANAAQYGDGRRHFSILDIVNDALPRVDLVFCRDLLVHFSFDDILRAIANLRSSGSTWLLTTTFSECGENRDIRTGDWRVINLMRPPFNFPPPLRLINEQCTEQGLGLAEGDQAPGQRRGWADKSLGLWRLADLEGFGAELVVPRSCGPRGERVDVGARQRTGRPGGGVAHPPGPDVRAAGDRSGAAEAAGHPATAVLVLAYSFPPIQVPMSPVVARVAAGLHQAGYAVDVICADPGAHYTYLPRDESLLDYVGANCRSVHRLRPQSALETVIRKRIAYLRDFPDGMAGLHESAVRAVLAAGPAAYAAVLTLAPFHTVNPVMVRVKKACPQVRWIAHFCDPWAGNPLERRRLAQAWAVRAEAETLRAADYVTHSSAYALENVLRSHPFLDAARTRVIPHCFDSALYPARPKRVNDKVTLRFVGTLFGRRSPAPLFRALGNLLARRPALRDVLRLDLIGPMDRDLRAWDGYGDLPRGLVCHLGSVTYLKALEFMYDADLLLVIEADIAATPFVPSKLTDYMGADTPIVGIAPAGGCREILDRLGCPTANPEDIDAIAAALETAIDRVIRGDSGPWCREEVRRAFDLAGGTAPFLPLIGHSDKP